MIRNATGVELDAIGSNYGIYRTLGESDQQLRDRISVSMSDTVHGINRKRMTYEQSVGITKISFDAERDSAKFIIEMSVPSPHRRNAESGVIVDVLTTLMAKGKTPDGATIADQLRAIANACDEATDAEAVRNELVKDTVDPRQAAETVQAYAQHINNAVQQVSQTMQSAVAAMAGAGKAISVMPEDTKMMYIGDPPIGGDISEAFKTMEPSTRELAKNLDAAIDEFIHRKVAPP